MKKLLLTTIFGFALALAGTAGAADNGKISNGTVKIGVLTDLSGRYKNLGGPGSVVAIKMAVKDFGGEVLGKPIKVIKADHHNKPALASSIARKWINQEHVDAIFGLTNSAVGLAVQGLASDKGVFAFNLGDSATALTEKQCQKYGIHYAYNVYSLPAGTATAVVKNGGDTWFFITADYVFGHDLQANTTEIVEGLGGKVVGSVDAPQGASDFSSYLIQAKASGAKVIALANAGTDAVNSIKQAHAFHITDDQQLVGLELFIPDIKGLGLETTQGLLFTTAFYWDRTDASRKWSKRFFKAYNSMPTMVQAGAYSAAMTYFKAIKKAGTDDAGAVRAKLGKMTINDMFAQGGYIQPNGLMVHDYYLVQVKSPEESKGPWDLLKVVSKIPAKEANIPLSKSQCPLLHNPS
jgi:branched-chain amino acid transport system substrate-binding protein